MAFHIIQAQDHSFVTVVAFVLLLALGTATEAEFDNLEKEKKSTCVTWGQNSLQMLQNGKIMVSVFPLILITKILMYSVLCTFPKCHTLELKHPPLKINDQTGQQYVAFNNNNNVRKIFQVAGE